MRTFEISLCSMFFFNTSDGGLGTLKETKEKLINGKRKHYLSKIIQKEN